MKRYIRFGPPDIDSEQDTNPHKANIPCNRKKTSKPETIKDRVFSAKVAEITALIGVEPAPQKLINRLSELKKI